VLTDCIEKLDAEQKARCLTTWGDLEVRATHYDAAELRYQEALSWIKAWAPAYSGLGSIEAAKGNQSKAENYFRRSLELDRGLRAAHYNLALLHRFDGNWDAATGEAKLSIENGIRGAPGLAVLGDLAYRRNQDARGHDLFVAAVAADPGNASTLTRWGSSLLHRGRIDEGNNKFRIAAKLRPASAAVFDEWGGAFEVLGLCRDAAEKRRLALGLDPENPGIEVNLV
jgi:tetratricopeptide (TPR) repeat protein